MLTGECIVLDFIATYWYVWLTAYSVGMVFHIFHWRELRKGASVPAPAFWYVRRLVWISGALLGLSAAFNFLRP